LNAGGRGLQADLHGGSAGIGSGRSASISYGRSASISYGRSGAYGYGHNGWRNRYYGVAVYGNSDSAYADDGCYYTYNYRRHTRVLPCATTE
jgi:hypothetical protein